MATQNAEKQENDLTYTKKVWIAAGTFSLFVVLLFLVKTLLSVLLLSFAAILMAVYFHGWADLVKKYLHLSDGWSLGIAIIINLILIVAFFWFVGARLQQQVATLSDTLPKTIEDAKSYLQQSSFGRKVLDYVQSQGQGEKTASMVKKFFSSSFGVISDLYIVLLLGIFFTSGPFLYKKGIVHLIPPAGKEKGAEVLEKLYTVLKNWIKGQIFGFFFIAIFTAIALWIIGMPLVLTLALIAGLLNFIPNFGPIIALIPAVLLALTKGTTMVILVICLYTFVQILQSAVTQPIIQKKMVSMPPAMVIFSQVAMGLLGGLWGVLVATPTVAVIMVLVNELYVREQSDHKYEVKPTAKG